MPACLRILTTSRSMPKRRKLGDACTLRPGTAEISFRGLQLVRSVHVLTPVCNYLAQPFFELAKLLAESSARAMPAKKRPAAAVDSCPQLFRFKCFSQPQPLLTVRKQLKSLYSSPRRLLKPFKTPDELFQASRNSIQVGVLGILLKHNTCSWNII